LIGRVTTAAPTLQQAGLAPRLAALGAITLWGLSFVATKAVLTELSPATLVFVRFALGTVVLAAVLAGRGHAIVPPRAALPMLAAMAFVGIFLHQMVQVHGLTLTTAVRTGWLIGLIPIWTALLSATLVGERLRAIQIVGLVVGLAGAILLVTRGELSDDLLAAPTTRGDVLVLASTLTWAVYTIMGRETLARLGSSRVTVAVTGIGTLMLLPLFLRAAGWHELTRLSGAGFAGLLFLGVGCSGLGYLFWYAALERLEPSQVAAFLYLEPLVTFVAAMALLGEPVGWTTVVGGLLVLAGVAAVQRA
jgi:drug/metabolite transporter (DMT)-like permease